MTAKSVKKKKPSGPGRLTAEDAAGIEDRVLDSAMTLFFSEDGYTGTSMERIAKHAGASTKTIYSRYANKDEVLQAVIRRTLVRVTAARAADRAVDPAHVEPRAFLASIARQVTRITMSAEGAGLNRLAFSEGKRFPDIAKFYREAMTYSNNQIRDALVQWKKDGLFTALDDVEAAAYLCHSMLTDRSRIWTAIGIDWSTAESETHLAAVVDTFLRGCGYKPRPA